MQEKNGSPFLVPCNLPLATDFMSIKADKWIRKMAEQHGMIEPFEPGQVKEVDGNASCLTARRATATTYAARHLPRAN